MEKDKKKKRKEQKLEHCWTQHKKKKEKNEHFFGK